MEGLPQVVNKEPSEYEWKAMAEIKVWKSPDMGWFGRAVDSVNRVSNQVTDLLRKIPGVDWTIENVAAGILKLTNEIVLDTVWTEAIFERYREGGFPVRTIADIESIDLEHVDRQVKGLAAKYRSLAAVEGVATGYAGAGGILPDIIALVAINLRAAGEYATYAGFDVRAEEERLFALQVLDAMSHPSDLAKQITLAPIIHASRRIARDQAVSAVEQLAVTRALRNAVRNLGVHLTEAKVAQLVPVVGAAVGGGFNAYYTSKVCDAAYFLYRERFLIRKYGEQMWYETPAGS